jgi:hypothetical protein
VYQAKPGMSTGRKSMDFRAAIPLHHEYLDREHTDVIQRVGDLSRYPASPKDGTMDNVSEENRARPLSS